ncbi:MAG TPA: hypothetical protein V6C97_09995 [Oculatellaceae cyanobacterium]
MSEPSTIFDGTRDSHHSKKCTEHTNVLHDAAYTTSSGVIVSAKVLKELDPKTQARVKQDANGIYFIPELGGEAPQPDLTPREQSKNGSSSSSSSIFRSDGHGDVFVDDSQLYIPSIIEPSRIDSKSKASATNDCMETGAIQYLPGEDNDLAGLPEFDKPARTKSTISGNVITAEKVSLHKVTEGSYTERYDDTNRVLTRVSKATDKNGTPLSVESYSFDSRMNLTRMSMTLASGHQESFDYAVVKEPDGAERSMRVSGESKAANQSKPVRHTYRLKPDGTTDETTP